LFFSHGKPPIRIFTVHCVERGETRTDIQNAGLFCAGFYSRSGELLWR